MANFEPITSSKFHIHTIIIYRHCLISLNSLTKTEWKMVIFSSDWFSRHCNNLIKVNENVSECASHLQNLFIIRIYTHLKWAFIISLTFNDIWYNLLLCRPNRRKSKSIGRNGHNLERFFLNDWLQKRMNLNKSN